METKKKCFIGLGGAGKNSLKPFLENEKNADFLVIDTETYDDYNCKWITPENTKEIVDYFNKDKDYIFLLGLSYLPNRVKTGVKLMKMIGKFLQKQNQSFTMILGLPFSFEYNVKGLFYLNKLRTELENLATKTIIINSDEFQKKYGEEEINILSHFHYLGWKNSHLSK